MKIVVFGADRRTGALHDGNVFDLCSACAKYLRELEGEPVPGKWPRRCCRLIWRA
jgi:hypothetical protein